MVVLVRDRLAVTWRASPGEGLGHLHEAGVRRLRLGDAQDEGLRDQLRLQLALRPVPRLPVVRLTLSATGSGRMSERFPAKHFGGAW